MARVLYELLFCESTAPFPSASACLSYNSLQCIGRRTSHALVRWQPARLVLHALRSLPHPVWLPTLLLLLLRRRRPLPCRTAACRLLAVTWQCLPHRRDFCLQRTACRLNVHVLRWRNEGMG